jgi:hypothetical protein
VAVSSKLIRPFFSVNISSVGPMNVIPQGISRWSVTTSTRYDMPSLVPVKGGAAAAGRQETNTIRVAVSKDLCMMILHLMRLLDNFRYLSGVRSKPFS